MPNSKAISYPFILLCGCIIAACAFGPRASFGLFTEPLTSARGIGLDVFSYAMAIQNLLWGLGQPFAGAMADKFGTTRVLIVGILLYATGLWWMSFAADPLTLTLSSGVLIGLGMSGASFNIVLAAFGKIMPPEWRGLSFGMGAAAGSFGQFLFSPLSSYLNRSIGWDQTLLIFAGLMLLILPFTFALNARSNAGAKPVVNTEYDDSNAKAMLRTAFSHKSYVLLVIGFFVCGFHLAFITIHLPKYLGDNGISLEVGGWVLALIGLANIAGSLGVGLLTNRFSRRILLVWIYALRGVSIAAFIFLPISNTSALIFGASMGLLWLSTVPPTNGLIALMFGTKWLAMLYGIAFLSHQIGAFVGLILGGYARANFGNYDAMWYVSIALGFAAALIHLPIQERAFQKLQPTHA